MARNTKSEDYTFLGHSLRPTNNEKPLDYRVEKAGKMAMELCALHVIIIMHDLCSLVVKGAIAQKHLGVISRGKSKNFKLKDSIANINALPMHFHPKVTIL